MMQTEQAGQHPAHGVNIEIGGRAVRLRGVFATACVLEEKFGRILDIGQGVFTGSYSVAELGNIFAVVVGDQATRGEIEAHFDDVGVAGVRTEVGAVLAQLLRGLGEISKNAEAAGTTAPLATRRKPGPKPGSKRKPLVASLGETSSPVPASSASASAISGPSPLSNTPAPGELSSLTVSDGNLQAQPEAPATTPLLFSDPFPVTA